MTRFSASFSDGVRSGAEATNRSEFDAALDLLWEAEQLVPELPPERRAQAGFFVGVRRAELLYHSMQRETAEAVALEARAAARRDGEAYSGYYRVLLLTLLWQLMPDDEFFDLVENDGEAEFVFEAATLAEVEEREAQLYVPLVFAAQRAAVPAR